MMKLVAVLLTAFAMAGPANAIVLNSIDFEHPVTQTATSMTDNGVTYAIKTHGGGLAPARVTINDMGVPSTWARFGAAAQTPAGSTYDRTEMTIASIAPGVRRFIGLKVMVWHTEPGYPYADNPSPKWNYFLQCPQGDLVGAVPLALGTRVSGGEILLELRVGAGAPGTATDRVFSLPLAGVGNDNYLNRPFYIALAYEMGAGGVVQIQVHRPWDGVTVNSGAIYRPIGYDGGTGACTVKMGLYRGYQDAQPGQNPSPGFFFALDDFLLTTASSQAKHW